jgi:glycosyl transferase family 28
LITLPKINNQYPGKPKILVAPLDWGLGHATRCIPIIKELLNNTCEVWIAASGDQKALLEEEFPSLPYVEIPGYSIKYGKNRASTLFKLFLSVPKILIRIKQENQWFKAFLVLQKPDAVISDNRYGLYAPGLSTVLITHQLSIKTSFGRIADLLLQRFHYRLINRFSRCWVPDFEGSQVDHFPQNRGGREEDPAGPDSLAGDLSHPGNFPAIPTRYIGPLSRFEKPQAENTAPETRAAGSSMPVEPSCDLLILLSGPEPQRTIFERLLLEQLAAYTGRTILVRGLPSAGAKKARDPLSSMDTPSKQHRLSTQDPSAKQIPLSTQDTLSTVVPPRVQVYAHLPAKQLNGIMAGAGMVISRAGYSTVMDLVKLGKRAILVPTPGQTEQEYLGRYLSGKKVVLSLRQPGFSLPDALARARDFPFAIVDGNGEALLAAEVRSLLKSLLKTG